MRIHNGPCIENIKQSLGMHDFVILFIIGIIFLGNL